MSLLLHVTRPVCATLSGTVHVVPHALRRKTRRTTYDTACGRRAKLLAFPTTTGDTMTVVWPPYASDAREWGFARCAECFRAVPGRPVRPTFAGVAS